MTCCWASLKGGGGGGAGEGATDRTDSLSVGTQELEEQLEFMRKRHAMGRGVSEHQNISGDSQRHASVDRGRQRGGEGEEEETRGGGEEEVCTDAGRQVGGRGVREKNTC